EPLSQCNCGGWFYPASLTLNHSRVPKEPNPAAPADLGLKRGVARPPVAYPFGRRHRLVDLILRGANLDQMHDLRHRPILLSFLKLDFLTCGGRYSHHRSCHCSCNGYDGQADPHGEAFPKQLPTTGRCDAKALRRHDALLSRPSCVKTLGEPGNGRFFLELRSSSPRLPSGHRSVFGCHGPRSIVGAFILSRRYDVRGGWRRTTFFERGPQTRKRKLVKNLPVRKVNSR